MVSPLTVCRSMVFPAGPKAASVIDVINNINMQNGVAEILWWKGRPDETCSSDYMSAEARPHFVLEDYVADSKEKRTRNITVKHVSRKYYGINNISTD